MDFGGILNGGGGDRANNNHAPNNNNNNNNNHVNLVSWYMEIPPVSRYYLTGSFLTTAACAVDLISPFSLYFNWQLVYGNGEVWRLITSYLFFGLFSFDYLFHMYFLVRYSRLLEEGQFRGRTAHYAFMLLFGIVCISILASYLQNVHFLGSALTFMMVYVWSRLNESLRMSFWGVINFTAPYLPWVMLTISLLVGNSIEMDVVGICVGHLYYYLEFVYPVVAEIRDWKTKRIFEKPIALFQCLLGGENENYHHSLEDDDNPVMAFAH